MKDCVPTHTTHAYTLETQLRKAKDVDYEGSNLADMPGLVSGPCTERKEHTLPLYSFHAPASPSPETATNANRCTLRIHTARPRYGNEKKTAAIISRSSIGISAAATPAPASPTPPPSHPPRPPPLPPLHARANVMGLHPRRHEPLLLLHLGKHCNLYRVP